MLIARKRCVNASPNEGSAGESRRFRKRRKVRAYSRELCATEGGRLFRSTTGRFDAGMRRSVAADCNSFSGLTVLCRFAFLAVGAVWRIAVTRLALLAAVALVLPGVTRSADPTVGPIRTEGRKHVVIYHRAEAFAGWPANGGMWVWEDGKEVLVGFETGKFEERKGHNITGKHANALARTTDGGDSWIIEKPEGYFQAGMKAKSLTGPIAFDAPDFAMRVLAEGYGVSSPGGCAVSVSKDRGRTWDGPFQLSGLGELVELKGTNEITNRTDYLPMGRGSCLLMSSARPAGEGKVDRVFAARLADGGRKVEFAGWVVSPKDPDRGVMPSTVRVDKVGLVTAVRRRPADASKCCWIDCYSSPDDGKSWKLLGKVADTGKGNGNPPALARLRDGRLCCVYGDRARREIRARLSGDDGATWGEELSLRDGYKADQFDEADLGYPRLFQRPDGKMVAVYYWADEDRPEPHIAATIWLPPAPR